jgi:IMP and pyridine-specific 5'-nucleotidase
VPFVLHSQPTAVYHEHSVMLAAVAAETHQRYAEILRDVERLINDHSIVSSRGVEAVVWARG